MSSARSAVRQYIIQDGDEQAVTKRMRTIQVATVLPGISITVHPLGWAVFLGYLVAGMYVYHAMYEEGWAIYRGTLSKWGNRRGESA
jgi:hypothetical protein